MPRRARVVVPGFAHHVMQRGNRRSPVFFDNADRLLYLERLRDCSITYGVKIWCYALMPDHIHLIAVPSNALALSNTLRDAHASYAWEFNRKYECRGHLWAARYYSCVLSDAYLPLAVRYVEKNPVRAGIVGRAEDYEWSSAAAHVKRTRNRYLDVGLRLTEQVRNWSSWLRDDHPEEEDRIRRATGSGRPCGSDDFQREIENQLGRNSAGSRKTSDASVSVQTAAPR